jgi:hypothetical protein
VRIKYKRSRASKVRVAERDTRLLSNLSTAARPAPAGLALVCRLSVVRGEAAQPTPGLIVFYFDRCLGEVDCRVGTCDGEKFKSVRTPLSGVGRGVLAVQHPPRVILRSGRAPAISARDIEFCYIFHRSAATEELISRHRRAHQPPPKRSCRHRRPPLPPYRSASAATTAAAEVILATTGHPTAALSILSARSITLDAAPVVHAPAWQRAVDMMINMVLLLLLLVFVAAVLASLVAHAASLVAMQLSIQLLFAALSLRPCTYSTRAVASCCV